MRRGRTLNRLLPLVINCGSETSKYERGTLNSLRFHFLTEQAFQTVSQARYLNAFNSENPPITR